MRSNSISSNICLFWSDAAFFASFRFHVAFLDFPRVTSAYDGDDTVLFSTDLAQVNSYFEGPAEITKKMLAIARSKRQKFNSVNTMEKIRQEQNIESLTKSMQKNEQRKSGE